MGCNSCGAENRATADFCGSCGKSLAAVITNGARPPDEIFVGQHFAAPPVKAAENGNGVGHRIAASDATRYLCAAVHLDSRVADQVIDEIVDQEYRAAPSSPDVDLRPVVKHALAARARQLTRDGLLCVLMVMMLGFLLTAHSLLFVITIVLCWAVVLGETLVATYGVLAHQLGPGNFQPETTPRAIDDYVSRRLVQLEAYRKSNVTVYSLYRPFVGHGSQIDAWSVALDVRRPADDKTARTFTAADIHDFVLARMREFPVGTVEVTERIYVDGRDIRTDERFLDRPLSAPRTQVDGNLHRKLMLEPEDRARPYLCLQVSGWNGQLVLSSFMRFVVTPKELFLEVSHSLLTPVRDEYQIADRLLPEPTLRQALVLAGQAVATLPILLLRAPGAARRFFTGPYTASRQRALQRRQITGLLRFNYGAPSSPRELVSDPHYQRYFQQLDTALYAKVLEKRLLHSVAEFFESQGIDTSELLEKGQTIENHGLFMQNATINADALAIGKGAKAKSRKKK